MILGISFGTVKSNLDYARYKLNCATLSQATARAVAVGVLTLARSGGENLMPHVDSASDERTVNNAMRHEYRVLTEVEKKAMTAIKDTGLTLIRTIELTVRDGREQSIATERAEEAVMWAIKGLTK